MRGKDKEAITSHRRNRMARLLLEGIYREAHKVPRSARAKIVIALLKVAADELEKTESLSEINQTVGWLMTH